MNTSPSRSRSAASAAAEILRRIFGNLEYGLNFRMWDGSRLSVGREVAPVTVIFTSLATFKRVLLNPEADAFAEAYCDGAIDFEGDLFEAMRVGDSLDEIDLGVMQKLIYSLRIWKLSE